MLHKYQAVGQTLCNKADGIRFHDFKCVNRECDNCGTSGLKQNLWILLQMTMKYPGKSGYWLKDKIQRPAKK